MGLVDFPNGDFQLKSPVGDDVVLLYVSQKLSNGIRTKSKRCCCLFINCAQMLK